MKKFNIIFLGILFLACTLWVTSYDSAHCFPPLPTDEPVVVLDIVSGNSNGKAFSDMERYEFLPGSNEILKLQEIFSKYTYYRPIDNYWDWLFSPLNQRSKGESGVVPWYVEGTTFYWIKVSWSDFDLATAGMGEISVNETNFRMTEPSVENDQNFVSEVRALLLESTTHTSMD